MKFSPSAQMVLSIGLAAIAGVLIYASSQSDPTLGKEALTMADAETIVQKYLSSIGEEDFAVEEIMEFSNHFYAMVQEKSTGINALELLVNRNTGTIFYEPGPNMMWNTKYGHMGRTNKPTASMPISAQEASEYAQKWLDANIPGARVEEPETFYGYYTVDVSKNGQTSGMLTVNGYTGDVWYHSWHGRFIEMVEYE